MKKVFTTLLILLGIYSVSSAQTRSTTEIGFNIGYNASNIYYSHSDGSNDYKGGFNAGISLEYYFSNNWGFKGKAIYDQKGWGNATLNFADGTEYGATVHLNYLTIPLMADCHFGRNRNWYLNFGPYVGFLLNANESVSNTDLKDGFNSTDFGFAAGIGVKFPVSNKVKMFVEVDGQAGLTDIFKDNPYSSIQNTRSSINVGFLIPMK
jgi:opacity protein-like surface antigen